MMMDELYRVGDPTLIRQFKGVASQLMARILARSRGDALEIARGFADRLNAAPWPDTVPAEGKPTKAMYRPALRHLRKVFVDMMEETALNEAFRLEPGLPWDIEHAPIMKPFMVKVREYFHTQGEDGPLPRPDGVPRGKDLKLEM